MKNLTCLFLCAFLTFSLVSCNKSDAVDDSEKVTAYRLHESVMTEAGIERKKSIYNYDSHNRLSRVQIQIKTAGAWINDSEITYSYSGSNAVVEKAGAYKYTYTFAKGNVTKFEESESTDNHINLFSYNSLGNLTSFTSDDTPFVVSYDSYNRFSSFSASFSALGETISLVGAAVYTDDRISSLTMTKSISSLSTLNAKTDFVYFSGLLLRSFEYSYDEDTKSLERIPTTRTYQYDRNNCLSSFAISTSDLTEISYAYSYEEGEGNAAIFEYSPDELLLKKSTGGMIK